jgi:hypothetical protein
MAVFLAGLLAVGTATPTLAADHSVSSGTAAVDCNANGIEPGDTITLDAGSRGPLKIRGCTGTAANPIVIRNDTTGNGPTVIRRTSPKSGDFVFVCIDCIHVTIDGSGKWSGAPGGTTYGIKVTTEAKGDSPSTFLMMAGRSSNFTIRNVEIDGRWPDLSVNGIGIQVNDNSVRASENQGVWRENIRIEKNYVHDVQGEGLYVGPNYKSDGLPLRNVKIRKNSVKRTGWDCIQAKMMREGTNSINHNRVSECGIGTDGTAGQHFGISCYESTGCRLYNNWVETTGETAMNCMTQFLPRSEGTQTCEIFNNVISNAGVTGPTDGDGIAVVISTKNNAAIIDGRIYNNTVVETEGNCIAVTSVVTAGSVRNNIAANCGNSSISAPNTVTRSNNLAGKTADIGFVDAGRRNFRLKSDSSAVNTATSGSPARDFDDVPRPQAGISDRGAYEFISGNSGLMPKPPSVKSNQ